MTLVELMIVIAIMALGASAAVVGVGAVTRTKLRAAATRVVAASRFARHRALSQGSTVRVVLDLDQGTLGFEEANGRVTLSRGSDDASEEAVDAWDTAQRLVANPDEPTLGASAFGPLLDDDGDPIGRYGEQPLEGVRVVAFHSPHEPAPRTSGRAAFYFFKNGTGEHTYVVLADSQGRKVTVELDALGSRGRIHAGSLDPDDIRQRTPRDPG